MEWSIKHFEEMFFRRLGKIHNIKQRNIFLSDLSEEFEKLCRMSPWDRDAISSIYEALKLKAMEAV